MGRTALDVFADRIRASGGAVALRHKENGQWKTLTWNDWDLGAREIAAGLRSLDVTTGDRVVILSDTRYEWVLCDLGILKSGAVVVPIYPSNLPDQCEYIINDSGSCVVIAEDPHQLEKLLQPEIRSKLSGVRKVVIMSDLATLERPDHKGRVQVGLDEVLQGSPSDWVVSLEDLRAAGKGWLDQHEGRLDEIASGVSPAQAATIVYTSGTTGPPKGVVLTHKNIAFECNAVRDLLQLGAQDEQLLFLPLAHIFARILEWAAIEVGCVTSFAEGLPQLIQNMGEVRPTFMGAVPRVYEKAYMKIHSGLEDKRKKAVGRTVVDWAMAKGKARSANLRAGKPAGGLGVHLADKLVFEKIRKIFGGRLRFFISGGAPLSADIAEFFHAAGVLILEGYGLTECTAASNINRPESYVFGSVGQAIPGVEVRIAEDGEILIRGDNIMREYYNKPEDTAEVIDADGWFHSGDIGRIEPTGHLRITDRKKDIIVTAGGKNIAPQNIENTFKAQCPMVSQMMVYGDKRKYLSALITLNEEVLMDWAKAHGISGNYAELTASAEVRKEIEKRIAALNATLASYETIKKFNILAQDLSQDSGELTPTLKVKRKYLTEKHQDLLNSMYEGAESSL